MTKITGNTSQDRLFDGRVRECVTCSEYEVKHIGFLTPLEQRRAFDIAVAEGASERCFFWGGAFDAERRMLFMLPEWMLSHEGALGGAFDSVREELFHEMLCGDYEEELSSAIEALEIAGDGYETFEHRDCLGALIGLGIERDAIGDIAFVAKSRGIVFLKPAAAALAVETLKKAGRGAVKIDRAEPGRDFRIPTEFELVNETVMSERLDGVVKAVYKMSREDAADIVAKGDVTLNYLTETKTDRMLVPGDVISVRGHGKFIYDGNGGVNRRGRVKIRVRKYV